MEENTRKERSKTKENNLKFQLDPQQQAGTTKYKKRIKKFLLLLLVVLQVGALAYIYRSSSLGQRSPIGGNNKSHKLDKRPKILKGHANDVVFHLPLLASQDMARFYTEVKPDLWCLVIGSIFDNTSGLKDVCKCKEGWQGYDCGVPPSVWDSGFLKRGHALGVKVERRPWPRRIIHSLVSPQEWGPQSQLRLNGTLEALSDLVEVFMLGFSGNGTPDVHSKLRSMRLNTPAVGKSSSSSSSSQREMAQLQALLWEQVKKRLSDLRSDDLVLMSDLKSLPSRELLTFLKLYQGFGEPVFFYVTDLLQNNNSSSLNGSSSSSIVNSSNKSYPSPYLSLCTFQFLRSSCNYDPRQIWSTKRKKNGRHWVAGSKENPAANFLVINHL